MWVVKVVITRDLQAKVVFVLVVDFAVDIMLGAVNGMEYISSLCSQEIYKGLSPSGTK